jgi:membrane protease YdiL (CAAX protease family)
MAGFRVDEPSAWFATAALTELGLGVVAMVLGWAVGTNVREGIPQWSDFAGVFRAVVWGGLVGVGLVVAMQGVSQLPLPSLERLNQVMDQRYAAILSPLTAPEMLVLALTSGIGEELLFRGWLQNWLIRLAESTSAGVPGWICGCFGWIVASVAFGMAHPISRTYVLLAGLIGLVLGALYLLTGSLLSCILAHAVYDAILLLMWRRRFPERSSSDGSDA